MRQLVADAAWHLLNVRNWEVTYVLLQTRTAEDIVRLSALCDESDQRVGRVHHVEDYPGGRKVIICL